MQCFPPRNPMQIELPPPTEHTNKTNILKLNSLKNTTEPLKFRLRNLELPYKAMSTTVGPIVCAWDTSSAVVLQRAPPSALLRDLLHRYRMRFARLRPLVLFSIQLSVL